MQNIFTFIHSFKFIHLFLPSNDFSVFLWCHHVCHPDCVCKSSLQCIHGNYPKLFLENLKNISGWLVFESVFLITTNACWRSSYCSHRWRMTNLCDCWLTGRISRRIFQIKNLARRQLLESNFLLKLVTRAYTSSLQTWQEVSKTHLALKTWLDC